MKLALLVALSAGLYAQVSIAPEDIAVMIDGKPFTTFHYGSNAAKPYLSPLRSASGKIVTRHFPMEEVAGESHDHLHHRGLWFSYDDVNGVKFWENDPSYTKPNMGRIVVRDTKWKGATLTAVMEWRAGDGKVLLLENRDMTFMSDLKNRMIDFNISLTAATEDVTFGDTKEGAFAIRLSDAFTEKKGMKMMDADGRTKMANIWGKRSNWVDYVADVEGEQIGVAMLDHPSNPRHPTYWHARAYGLISANPFAAREFSRDDKQDGSWSVAEGKSIRFAYRVVIHLGDAQSAGIAAEYGRYAGK